MTIRFLKVFWAWALVACLSAMLLTSCGGGATDTQLTQSDSGKAFTLNTGDTLTLRLVANATTGYQWGVMEGDEAVIKLQGDPEYIADQPQAIGSGGVSVFHFKAMGAGATTLMLGYFPPDGSLIPTETFAVQLTVK